MPEDRVALAGPNGAGKSPLVRHILEQLRLPEDKLLYLAQEIGREEARRILDDVRSLDRARLGEVMQVRSVPRHSFCVENPARKAVQGPWHCIQPLMVNRFITVGAQAVPSIFDSLDRLIDQVHCSELYRSSPQE
jgi:ABC-type phosphate/phosphonate transport system ATPase subunit